MLAKIGSTLKLKLIYILPGVNLPEPEANNSSPSKANVKKNMWMVQNN
jgi:hypothetical protein